MQITTFTTASRQPSLSSLLLAGISLLCLSLPLAAADGFAYVSNQKGNVSIIDLSNFKISGEIDVGGGSPRGIGISDDGKTLVVAAGKRGDVAVVDVDTRKVVKRIPIGKNPEFVRVRGNLAFVSFEPAAAGGPPPKPGSKEEMQLRKQRQDDDDEPARVAIIDFKAGTKVKDIVAGMETEGIEFTADGKHIVVTNEYDNNLSVHEIDSGKRVKTIDTLAYGHRPRGIKLSPDGKTYVATIEFGNHFVVMDSNFTIIKSVETGETPYGLSFNQDGSRLYVALANGEAIQVFDTSNYQVIANYPVGKRCWHFSFTRDQQHLVVACGRSNDIHVISAADGKQVAQHKNQAMPWGVVTYPKAMGSLDRP